MTVRGNAIITGGAHGIGAAICSKLAESDVRVCIVDHDGEAAAALAVRLGGRAYVVDVTDAMALATTMSRITAECPTITTLVNNAGGSEPGRLEGLTIEQWDAAMALNLRAAFVTTQGVLAAMRAGSGGSIINVASIAAHRISPIGGAAYAAAKAGLLALTRQTAFEWSRYRIRANAVCPGPTRSALTRKSRRIDADFPFGRWICPDDVAGAVAFLASDAAAMITGAVLDIDGGVSLR